MKAPTPWPKPSAPMGAPIKPATMRPVVQEPFWRLCPNCGEMTPTHGTYCRMCGLALNRYRTLHIRNQHPTLPAMTRTMILRARDVRATRNPEELLPKLGQPHSGEFSDWLADENQIEPMDAYTWRATTIYRQAAGSTRPPPPTDRPERPDPLYRTNSTGPK